MGHPDQRIIVVKRDKLFGENYFQGFHSYEGINFEGRILRYMETMRRGSTNEPLDHPQGNAEMNPDYKQPIGYTVIADMQQGKVFAYQRSSDDKNYGEKRLQGKWSWGFGGHIEPIDNKAANPIRESVLREVLKEEVKLPGKITKLEVLGYINEDIQKEEDTKLGRPSISRVHFGILYLLNTDSPMLMIKDEEIARVELKTVSELEELCKNKNVEVEGWSKIALEALRKIL